MASIIDLEFLGNFSIVFMFLLVWTIMYAMLTYINFFKFKDQSQSGLNAVIALGITILVLVNAPVLAVTRVLVPWFFVLILFIFLMLLSVRMFGLGEADMVKIIKDRTVHVFIIIFSVVILLFALGSGFGQELLEDTTQPTEGIDAQGSTNAFEVNTNPEETATEDYNTNLVSTLFNAKVLGMLVIFFIAMFMFFFLTKGPFT